MIVLLVCTAALTGIGVTEVTHPLPLAPLLLAALLAGVAIPLTPRQPVCRRLALAACALSLGAMRGSISATAGAPFGITETLAASVAWPFGAAETLAASVASPISAVEARLAVLAATLQSLRAAADAGIRAWLPEPQASLAAGVLLGGSGALDPAFRTELQRSGLGHLVAIDGFKLVVVAGLVGSLARRLLGPSLALLPTLLAIASYTLVSGAHPSAIRAALMVSLALVGSAGGRVAEPLTSLSVATLGMALVDPGVLLDLGLQLSVSATLGIVLLEPVLHRRLPLRRLPKLVGEPVGLTLAVTLACLPVTLSRFQVVSLASPVAHIVAVPLLPVVLVASGVLAVAAALPLPGAQLVGVCAWLAWLPTSLLAATIHLVGSLPGAAISTGRLPPLAAGLLAGVLVAWGVWYMPELSDARRAWRRWWSDRDAAHAPAGLISACAVALVLLLLMRPGGQVAVSSLSLGRGEAVFVRGPTGRTTLVVRGNADARALADAVADHLDVWEHKLDQVIVLDPGAQKALGLTLARYPADELTRAPPDSQVDLGAGQTLTIASDGGRLAVAVATPGARVPR
ncbi:MAG: ComEC/Rec2 family competence protein [Chloroflexi bacterium]|nr:ComEC/Rec2 family competence protein [Chloroflexota bacterium]